MPKMPESEKKEEESAESREERKEQVVDECRVYCDHGGAYLYFVIIQLIYLGPRTMYEKTINVKILSII